jgi:hypothetical protein
LDKNRSNSISGSNFVQWKHRGCRRTFQEQQEQNKHVYVNKTKSFQRIDLALNMQTASFNLVKNRQMQDIGRNNPVTPQDEKLGKIKSNSD